jgi:hypothetical protein
MKFVEGNRPEWKGKPKASLLDTDAEFLELRKVILDGKMEPFQEVGVEVDEEADGKRLKTKNPARLVRDRLKRLLKEENLEALYKVTCRQTATPKKWGVWVLRTAYQ